MVQINNFKAFLPFPERFELREYNLIKDSSGNYIKDSDGRYVWKLTGKQFITVLDMKQHHYTQDWFVKVLNEKNYGYGDITEEWMSVNELNSMYELNKETQKKIESEKSLYTIEGEKNDQPDSV